MADNSILMRLDGLKLKYEELGQKLTDPEVIADVKSFVQYNKEFKELEPIVETSDRYRTALANLAEAKDILANDKEEEMREMAREEIAELEHLDGDFSFVLESDGYTSFSDSCKRPLVAKLDLTDFRFGRATHGYYPDLGPQPTLIAKGPHIKEGVVIDRRPIVDEAPTYAKLLGAELPDAQGTAIEEILK